MAPRKNVRIDTGLSFGDEAIWWIAILFILSMSMAWLTHVIWIIRKLAADGGVTVGQMVLGGLGTLMPPVGVIHGYMIWFGSGL